MNIRLLFAMIALLALTVSCAPAEDTGADTAASDTAGGAMADTANPDDMLSGAWAGDWGPTPEHRNPVTLELTWDGTDLTGTVNPGPNAIELEGAGFDPATGTLTMEAQATNFRGEEVHYMIEGQLDGDTISGSWNHDDTQGDFSISRN